MNRYDPRIILDAETTAALEAPGAPAWPGPSLQDALQAADAPAERRGGFLADDDGAVMERPAAPAGEAVADDTSPEPGSAGPIAAGPDRPVRESPAEAAPGEALSPPGASHDTTRAGGSVSIHVVNYYARPHQTLCDLPNEWAGNRGRA